MWYVVYLESMFNVYVICNYFATTGYDVTFPMKSWDS
jgi:hypothetical protein